jgi:hypothetical protein
METVCWQINDFVAEKDQIADKMMSAGTILVPRSDGLTPNEVMKERAQFGDKLAASRFFHTHPSLHQPSCGVINARPRGLPLRPTPLDVTTASLVPKSLECHPSRPLMCVLV